jgi:hypothetical protein
MRESAPSIGGVRAAFDVIQKRGYPSGCVEGTDRVE